MESNLDNKLAIEEIQSIKNKKWENKLPEMFEGKIVMSFERAMMHMREGKKVQLVGGGKDVFFYIENNNLKACNVSANNFVTTIEVLKTEYIITGKWYF